MPDGSESVWTRCSGRPQREVREPAPARLLPVTRRGRRANLQVLPVVLSLLFARVQGVRPRPRDAEDGLAPCPLQPVEPRRRGLPGTPAPMILAGVLAPLEDVLRWLLEHLHDPIGLSWGWSIIGLTVIVRVLLLPLMVRQIHSMQSMQSHLPEMKAIQQKYKGDRQRLNEEL